MERGVLKSLFFPRYKLFPRQRKEAIFLVAALCTTVLASLLLFNANVTSSLISIFIDLGLDPMRAQFVTFLLVTSAVAFVGALLSRKRGVIILVAVLVFFLIYLISFVHLELQPARDPGGTLEVLNGLALLHTASMMIALAYLCAF